MSVEPDTAKQSKEGKKEDVGRGGRGSLGKGKKGPRPAQGSLNAVRSAMKKMYTSEYVLVEPYRSMLWWRSVSRPNAC